MNVYVARAFCASVPSVFLGFPSFISYLSFGIHAYIEYVTLIPWKFRREDDNSKNDTVGWHAKSQEMKNKLRCMRAADVVFLLRAARRR